jgi:hypothetical protein
MTPENKIIAQIKGFNYILRRYKANGASFVQEFRTGFLAMLL